MKYRIKNKKTVLKPMDKVDRIMQCATALLVEELNEEFNNATNGPPIQAPALTFEEFLELIERRKANLLSAAV